MGFCLWFYNQVWVVLPEWSVDLAAQDREGEEGQNSVKGRIGSSGEDQCSLSQKLGYKNLPPFITDRKHQLSVDVLVNQPDCLIAEKSVVQ